jgi:hypothetical protein
MDDPNPLGIWVEFSVAVSGAPWDDSEQFIHEVTGKIHYMTDDGDELEIGQIKVLKISEAEATNRNESLYDVFDSHSQFLVWAYQAIFDEDGDTKPELGIEAGYQDILVLWEFEVQPDFRHQGVVVSAFEAAIAFFAPMGLIVAARVSDEHRVVGLDLTVDEWKQLEFVRIADSPFVFRDGCMLSPYREKPADGS